MRRGIAHKIALGGILAALAVVIMCLIGLIPVATFICPMLCILICGIVYRNCGSRISWAWYGAVSVMSVIFAPDKEGVLLFLFIGYYPILKIAFDRTRLKLGFLCKALFFNSVIIVLYLLVLRILGLHELLSEYQGAGYLMGAASVFLGNIAFFLLDFVLNRILYSNTRNN